MLLSPRKNGLTSLFKEVWVFKEIDFLSIFLRKSGCTKFRVFFLLDIVWGSGSPSFGAGLPFLVPEI